MRLSSRQIERILGPKPDPVTARVDGLEAAIHEVRAAMTLSASNVPATYDDAVLIGRIASMERAITGISQGKNPPAYSDANVLARIDRLEKLLMARDRPREWNFEIVRDGGGNMTKIIAKAEEAKAANRRKD